jgi:RimJ/RimL family protein N-acetyltransferase
MTPALESARLVLVPYTRSLVAQEHIDWLNDRELMQYSEQRHHTHSLRSEYLWLDSFSPDSHIWLIRCGRDDIGTITAMRDRTNQTADMGILVGDELYRSSGYGAEAWQRVMRYLFEDGVRKVTCGCRGDNWRMRRLALAVGMQLEAEIEGHFLTESGPQAAAFYGRFASDAAPTEWQKMWEKPFWGAVEASS